MNIEPTEGRREKRTAYRAGIGRKDVPGGLAEQVATPKFWPTPQADDAKNVAPKDNRRFTLVSAVNRAKYPTLKTNGFCGGSGAAGMVRGNADLSEDEKRSMLAGNGGKLNPDWVELLMGWPQGWTSLEPLPAEAWERWLAAVGNHWPDGWDDGIPKLVASCTDRVARLKGIGNGQVPQAAALAWDTLDEEKRENNIFTLDKRQTNW